MFLTILEKHLGIPLNCIGITGYGGNSAEQFHCLNEKMKNVYNTVYNNEERDIFLSSFDNCMDYPNSNNWFWFGDVLVFRLCTVKQ